MHVCSQMFNPCTSTVSQATSGMDSAKAGAGETEPGKSGKDYVTRNEQLEMKAKSKASRKKKGGKKKKCKKGKGKKVCKAERLKRSRSRGLNILRASPTKRKVQSITEDADEAPEDREEPMERKCRKKKIPSGSSTDRKGRTRKTSGATGTPEPKGRAKPKGKSKPKAKAKPKAKGKARAKAQSQKGPEEVAEEFRSDSKSSSEQFTDISNFLDRFEPYEKVQDKRFKSFARSLIPDLEKHSLDNIYWTRGNVGITKLETGKDILHFSFNQSSATDAQKMAVSIKCAIIAVTQRS